MSHLIKILAVCKISYFRLWYLKSLLKTNLHLSGMFGRESPPLIIE